MLYKTVQRGEGSLNEDGARLFSRDAQGTARGNGHNLQQEKSRKDVRKNYFILRMVQPWNRAQRSGGISILGDFQNLT